VLCRLASLEDSNVHAHWPVLGKFDGRNSAVRYWIERVLVILCVTALGCVTESYREDTDEALIHLNRGVQLFGKRDLNGAIAEYRTAIRFYPNYAVAHMYLGDALAAKRDWDGAIAEYQTTIELAPNNTTPHYNLGLALAAKQDWDGAIAEYRTVLRLAPNHTAARIALDAALRTRGEQRGGT